MKSFVNLPDGFAVGFGATDEEDAIGEEEDAIDEEDAIEMLPEGVGLGVELTYDERLVV